MRRRNWAPAVGVLLGLAGVASYFTLVLQRNPAFNAVLDVPVAFLAVLAVGLAFSLAGVRRAYGRAREYRGRVVAPVLAAANLGLAGYFVFFLFASSSRLPEAAGAPRVGAPAPDFVLPDERGQPVQLAALRGRNALLVFYRGHW